VVRDNDCRDELRPSEHCGVGQARVGTLDDAQRASSPAASHDNRLPCLAVGRKMRTDPRGVHGNAPGLMGGNPPSQDSDDRIVGRR